MARTTAYPAALDSFATVPDQGAHNPVSVVAAAVLALETQIGTVPATASTPITVATAVTLTVASGCVRTLSTINLAGGVTITISTAGATHGQCFEIYKLATGGTGAVTIDARSFTTHKKFNASCRFINGAWRLVGYNQYA